MKIFAISDLHLSLQAPFDHQDPEAAVIDKPMSVFGEQWQDALSHITNKWKKVVGEDDVVLIPGDISWAMKLDDARYDFAYLASLPGKKIISRGNHDFWWDGIGKLRAFLPEGIYALQHDAMEMGDFAICATRGWLLPEHNDFSQDSDQKIYEREILRLGFALEAAAKYQKPIIAMLHYPPLDKTTSPSGFVSLLQEYPVHVCLYGHIHGNKAAAFEGEYAGIAFRNVSADRIGFTPLLIAGS